MSKNRPKTDQILMKKQTKTGLMGPLPGPVEQKTDQNPEFCRLITLHPSPNPSDETLR